MPSTPLKCSSSKLTKLSLGYSSASCGLSFVVSLTCLTRLVLTKFASSYLLVSFCKTLKTLSRVSAGSRPSL